jgi:hypothetical protein
MLAAGRNKNPNGNRDHVAALIGGNDLAQVFWPALFTGLRSILVDGKEASLAGYSFLPRRHVVRPPRQRFCAAMRYRQVAAPVSAAR